MMTSTSSGVYGQPHRVSEEAVDRAFVGRMWRSIGRVGSAYLDKSTLYPKLRWLLFALLLMLYCMRVYWLEGFFVVTYGLGIYLLNLLIGFISPQVDPETDELVLPVREAEEYRPFQRQLLEFKCWTSGMRAVLISLFLTCFSIFDLPVFWPILLVYFLLLFFLTMKQQIKRMIKYKYLPFSWGKQTYGDITRAKHNPPAAAANTAAACGAAAAPPQAAAAAGGFGAAHHHGAAAMRQQQLYYSDGSALVSQPAATAPGAAVSAFTAQEHFTTPYVLR